MNCPSLSQHAAGVRESKEFVEMMAASCEKKFVMLLMAESCGIEYLVLLAGNLR